MIKKEVVIGDCRLLLGDCIKIMPLLGTVSHIISDPPYEDTLHKSKNSLVRSLRTDSGPNLKGLDFSSIDIIRNDVVLNAESICEGWFIVFCTVEGVARWADVINPSSIKYKRACFWIKPDCTPQLNGQGPAQGAECFVCSWNGEGHAKWNSGGKRGVYTHNTNSRKRDGRHPTEKPVSLMAEILRDFTNEGDLILDPFAGSGTTGVACSMLGRKFIGIEQNETYFEIACDRIKKTYEQDLFVRPFEQIDMEGLT